MHYVIYHQVKPGIDCPDGYAAAWVASKKYPEAELVGCCYNDARPLPEFQTGDELIIVDFSFPATQMESWANTGIKVMVIDHHKTALENLSGLSDRILQHFDMDECGATLTWKTLFPDKPMPAFLEFVRSRDLWLDCDLFSEPIPETLRVHEAISYAKYTQNPMEDRFNIYQSLAKMSRTAVINWANAVGLPRLHEKRSMVKSIANRATPEKFKTEDGTEYRICLVRLNPDSTEDRYVSDICSYLNNLLEPDFCACITSTGEWSLRSDRNGSNVDVGAIAKSMGGGGHHNSSGFTPN